MSVSINKAVLFGLIVAIGIIIILPFLFVIYLQSQYDIILHTFDFGNTNRLFQSINNKIIMHSGHGFLAPNDELAVSFNFNNGYNAPVEVITTMFKQVGDQKTNLPLGDFFVARNNNDTQAYTFHVSSEGENDLYFVITLKNSTSHQFIQNLTTSVIPLTAESVSSKLQEQANTITFSTLIVSGIIGGATVYTLFRTRQTSEKHTTELEKQTEELRKSNELLKNENKVSENQIGMLQEQNQLYRDQFVEENRPWISVTDVPPRADKEPNFIRIYLKNFGKSVAKDIVVRTTDKDNAEITEEELSQCVPQSPISMAPSEIWTLSIPLSPDMYQKTENSDSCHFGIQVDYKYGIDKDGKMILIGYWQGSTKVVSIMFVVKKIM